MLRHLARIVVVEIANRRASFQQTMEVLAVGVEGDVEDRDLVTGRRVHAPEQLDVAFDAGDECCVTRIGQAKLLQRTEAVGVAVECVEARHVGVRAPSGAITMLANSAPSAILTGLRVSKTTFLKPIEEMKQRLGSDTMAAGAPMRIVG